VSLSAQGVRVTVDQSKSVQANAFLNANLFSDFRFPPGEEDATAVVEFGIPLDVLLECLTLFGNTSPLPVRLVYERAGSPLMIKCAAVDMSAHRCGGSCWTAWPR
jgi:cell cycle checkpoint protein